MSNHELYNYFMISVIKYDYAKLFPLLQSYMRISFLKLLENNVDNNYLPDSYSC